MKLIILLCFFHQFVIGQNHSDADRLKNLSYMQNAERINCDSMTGTTLEHRICLNLEFQKVDSILNSRFSTFLQTVENDSLKLEIETFHDHWIKDRHLQSKIQSAGFRGHMLGIAYLGCMVNMTKRRIEELAFFLGEID